MLRTFIPGNQRGDSPKRHDAVEQAARRSALEILESRRLLATIVGWELGGVGGWGSQGLSATTIDAGVTSAGLNQGLTRGSGVTTSGTAASNAFGGTNWTASSRTAAMGANTYISFGFKVESGKTVDLTRLEDWNMRHSSSGPKNWALEYSINGSAYTQVGTDQSVGTGTSASGNAATGISLSSVPDLAPNDTITFRMPFWGATSATGTGYINGVLAGEDFVVSGNVNDFDVDGPGLLSVETLQSTVNEDAGTITFTVNRLGGTLGTVSADILLTPGTATASDYGSPSIATVTFADGDSTPQTFTVAIVDDTRYEVAEKFSVQLANPTGSEGAPTLGLPVDLTIVDNDVPFFSESFENEPTIDPESGNAVADNYRLEGPLTSTNQYEYFDRYAVAGAAYPQNIFNGIHEGHSIQGEHHNGTGFGPDGADPTRTITIPNIDITGKQDISVFASLGANVSSGAFEDWTLGDGISIYATIDGGERTLIGQFKPAGLTGSRLMLDTDLDGQGDGTSLNLTMRDFAFAVPGSGQSLTLEIDATSGGAYQMWALDNVRVDASSAANTDPVITSDGGQATAELSIVEGTSQVTTVIATDADAGQTLSYSIAIGSDEANEDSALFAIDPLTGALSFHTAPDFNAPLDLNMDNVYRVTVVVSDDAGGIDTQELSITVTNAPAPGEFAIGDAIVNEADGTVTLTVTRSNGSDGAVELGFATSDGTALAGEDYTASTGTVSFADGETSCTITVGIANDNLVEADETFSVVLSGVGVNITSDTAVVTIVDNDVYATVQNRLTFYNNSFYDTGSFVNGVNGNRAKTNDDAIATDKAALRSGTATFANYTSYDKGINGLIVDLANVPNPASISASDFLFHNTGRLNTATPVEVIPTSVTTGAGPDGTTRVYITFADYAIVKTWLRTTVLANANTRLESNDVFYFGNAIGESGNSSSDATVNSSDDVNARNNPRNPGQRSADQTKIDLNYDFNRDGLVNSSDQVLPRNHATNPGTRLGLVTI